MSMDGWVKNMDSAATDWWTYRRRYPSVFPLGVMGLIEQKWQWIDGWEFSTCNFSLIFEGRGEYWWRGQRLEVRAPCVLIQCPGERISYGPKGEPGWWRELYLIYNAKLMGAFVRQKLLDPDRPVWPMANPEAVESLARSLVMLGADRRAADVVDRGDRIAEQMLLETHLKPAAGEGESAESALVRRMERELSAYLEQEVDVERVVEESGVSMRTFRRRWAEVIAVSPARYRQQARLKEACRLLARTDRPVYEIAHRVGFRDELYFSRRFRQDLKMSPREYRGMSRANPNAVEK